MSHSKSSSMKKMNTSTKDDEVNNMLCKIKSLTVYDSDSDTDDDDDFDFTPMIDKMARQISDKITHDMDVKLKATSDSLARLEKSKESSKAFIDSLRREMMESRKN